jgi:hypothetical protein
MLIDGLKERFAPFSDPLHPCSLAAMLSPYHVTRLISDKDSAKATLTRLVDWLVFLKSDDDGKVVEGNAGATTNASALLGCDDGAADADAAAVLKRALAAKVAKHIDGLQRFAFVQKCSFDMSKPLEMDELTTSYYLQADPDIRELFSLIYSAAASSAASERVFSASGLHDTYLRNRMSAEVLEMLTVVKCFFARSPDETVKKFFIHAEQCFQDSSVLCALKKIVEQQSVEL